MEIKAGKQKIVSYLNSILKNFKGKHIRARNLIIIVIGFFFIFLMNHFEWCSCDRDIFSVLHYC